MKKSWLFGCCLLFALPTWGQGRDTVLAVHKLFRQQRPKGGEVGAAAAAPLLPAGRPAAAQIAVAAGSGATAAVLGAVQGQRFSAAREADIIERYGRGEPIPADIRRRLRGALFKRTAKDVQAGF